MTNLHARDAKHVFLVRIFSTIDVMKQRLLDISSLVIYGINRL